MSAIKKGVKAYLKSLAIGKKITIEENIPFKACITDVVNLCISDGQYSIQAVYSSECQKEFATKFEYLKFSELESVNIMVNRYYYFIHNSDDPRYNSVENTCLKILIHSIKPFLNEDSITGAGVNILENNKKIKAGLRILKYKRMQELFRNDPKQDIYYKPQSQRQGGK